MRTSCLAAIVLIVSFVPARAAAPLGGALPSETVVYAGWRATAEDGLIDVHLRAVRQELRTSGFLDDYVSRLRENVAEDDRGRFDVESSHWRRILAAVDWWRLLGREVAIGAVVSGDGDLDWVLLSRVGAARRDSTILALREILHGFSAVFDDYELVEGDRDDVPTSVLYNAADPGEQLGVGGHGDVVALSTSAHLLRQCLQLLAGRGSDLGLIHGEEYRTALSELIGEEAAAREPDRPDDRFEIVVLPGETFRAVPTLYVFERYHLLGHREGNRVSWDSLVRLRESIDSPLARAFAAQRDVGDFSGLVPAGVASFSVSSGAELYALYDYLMDLLEVLSGGPRLPGVLQALQNRVGYDLKERLLQHLTGRRISLSMPVETPEADSAAPPPARDSLWLFETKSADGARERLATELLQLAVVLEKTGFDVETTDLEGNARPVFELRIETLIGRPLLFGLVDDHLALATSRAALRRFLELRAGRAPGIQEDPTFRRVWKSPSGRLDAVFWGEAGGTVEAIGSLLRVLGGVARLLPPGSEEGDSLRAFCGALPRLRAAVAALDIVRSRVGHTLREERGLRGRSTTFLRRAGRL